MIKKQQIKNPITTEVIGSSLISIADEMSITLQRTAYSSIVREALDFSTAIFTPNGELIAQADNIPTHLGTMGGTLKRILKDYFPRESIYDGDQILINHPYLGASHAPDFLLFTPVFVDDQHIGFCASMCHHVDVGGSSPGNASAVTELFQEGLLLPPIKLYEKGVANKAVFEIIKSNIRMPDVTIGDLHSQISANEIGRRRMSTLFTRYGINFVFDTIQEWFNYSEKRTRAKIKKNT